MKRTIITFTILIIALLLLFRLSTVTIFRGNLRTEIVLAVVAIVFFLIGVFINKRASQNQNTQKEKNYSQKIEELGLSKREYEVLQEVASGLSNREIADKLFVSESTVKTHVSNLFLKLNAQRRTQAIQIAQDLGIL